MAYQPLALHPSTSPMKHPQMENYSIVPRDSDEDRAQHEQAGNHSKLSSSWKTYWWTQTTMLLLFAFALIIAALHVVVFAVLDGKPVDGPDSLSQSYVAALSHLLGLLFRTALCGSLAVAFTQCLWHLLRAKLIQVTSIELLFKIMSNPFLLTMPEVAKTAPLLFALALFTWLLPIAVTFPPGALIVVSTEIYDSYNTIVPTYNSSFLGNGSWADARTKYLSGRGYGGGNWQYLGATLAVQHTGRTVLEIDDIINSPSPCTADCTYTTQFDGPYLQCSRGNYSHLLNTAGGTQSCSLNAFTATTVKFSGVQTALQSSQFHIGHAFNMTAYRLSKLLPATNGTSSGTLVEHDFMSCVPSRASYNVTVTYRGGLRTITHSQTYLGSISKMIKPVYPNVPSCSKYSEPCFNITGSVKDQKMKEEACKTYYACQEYEPANFSQPVRETFSAFNDFAILDSVISPLSGNYTMFMDETFLTGGSDKYTCGPTNGSIVADTRLNVQRNNFTRTPVDGPKFVLSADILNQALFNATLSTAYRLGFWNTTVPVHTTSVQQQYSFASRRIIIIPYISCLVLSLPFLFLGVASLRSNGVSAIDGGFLQILMTTTGSKVLENAAAGGCLGGDENVPENLKKMKIRFGELSGNEFRFRSVRRAGFGTEDEVSPLRYGVDYGMDT